MRKHHEPPSTSPLLKKIIWILTFLLFLIGTFFIGYFFGYEQAENELISEREETRQMFDQIKKITTLDEEPATPRVNADSMRQEREIRRLKQELQKVLAKERPAEALKPQHEYAPKDKKALPPPPAPRPLRPSGGEGKLTIIMDDVSYERDVKAIESVGLPIVMSFLPPSYSHPDSAALAAGHKGYMVHLPLEAVSYSAEEPITLRVSDSTETIAKQIASIKRLYPNVHYINNHTGSKFTADAAAMEKLIKVMRDEGIIFVDSRTIGSTKVPQVCKKFGLRYLGRDVFLDHQDGVENVKRQIKEAVEKAKQHGSAIAIGHPRPDTIEALKQSRALLSEVKLVGIGEI
ncbi:MAG: divergent polysaccharide deacetylase family protein [Sulfuricurvum sp.]|jgi:hypothetical protein|uniref:divergent polysaccharide deacetylase family protein n=1 Tax=Sulfuricurvum sp. TaxID=2025608 RepID=UPI0025F5FD03|nr:divergent polysaccharide deacetylase family protein [Sulfuricurvum sp.]MCK9372776.1 divergent polysaccharide deacetylase family protein [Sulfuricurvum sp.]